MDVVVDLNHSDYRLVLPILKWCLENDIDSQNAEYLLECWRSTDPYENPPHWRVTVPDEYATMFLLKFSDDQHELAYSHDTQD